MTRLLPFDVAVALRLLAGPATYANLAAELRVYPSQVLASVRRLQYSGLLRQESLEVNRSALREFLFSGARYAFPARPGAISRGVPTSHSAPALEEHIDSTDHYVWPSASGTIVGEAIEPLYPKAAELVERSPETYRLLTLFDALRVGRARERNLAKQFLDDALRGPPLSAA